RCQGQEVLGDHHGLPNLFALEPTLSHQSSCRGPGGAACRPPVWCGPKGDTAMEPGRAWTRRGFGGTGSVFAATTLLGSRRAPGLGRWLAARRMSAPPAVDRLAVRVVVDNAQDALQRSARVGGVEVERVGMIMEPDLSRQVVSQFGLGYHVESRRGEETRAFLVDFGPTAPRALSSRAA